LKGLDGKGGIGKREKWVRIFGKVRWVWQKKL